MPAPLRVELPNGFTPRWYQRPFMQYLDQGGKRAFWVLHRRGGKDLTAAHETSKLAHLRRGGYWHIFPTAEQGRKAIWEGFTKDGQRIMEQVFPASIRKAPRAFLPQAEMVVELKCGSIWRLMGSDRMEVVGAGPVGVVFSEFALAKPRTWDLVRPMLRENDGWAAFITTPRGKNHAYELFKHAQKDPSWFCDLKTLHDTRAYDPELTIAEERASGMPEALIQQEYFCDWNAASVGTVFGELVSELEARGGVSDFETDPSGIYTSWDLGKSDSTAIWFWRLNAQRGLDVVDYYEAHGKDLPHYFGVLAARGYAYKKHWLPHDARAKTLVSRVSILDQCLDALGRDKVAITPSLSVLDGIHAARRLLLDTRTRMHTRCHDGLEALKAYRYEYDEDTKAFSRKPLHDWASNGSDAFRYLGVVAEVSELISRPEPKPSEPKVRTMDSFSLDDLWETAPSAGGGRF